MAALTFRIGILRNGVVKHATVNDPVSSDIEQAVNAQIKNWREELYSIEFQGKTIFQAEEIKSDDNHFFYRNLDAFIDVEPKR